jgi:hypothetical protein
MPFCRASTSHPSIPLKQKASHSAMVGRWQVLTVVYYPAPVTPILRPVTHCHIVTPSRYETPQSPLVVRLPHCYFF